MKPDQRDAAFMELALTEARKGLGRTRPNPAVGAVVVSKGRVIARGHHRRAGQPHAEIEALKRAGSNTRGTTLYVTLEPCAHVGRTGPCVDTIIAAGVDRVVVACNDRNPLVDGRGIARLRRAGIKVTTGCLEPEGEKLYRGFFCWIQQGRPLVTLKAASSLDGIIGETAKRGDRARVRWITGPKARRAAQGMRALHDAILVGVDTILADDPQLTIRDTAGAARAAGTARADKLFHLRVVLDTQLRTPPDARLLRARAPRPPLIIAARPKLRDAAFARRHAALQRKGAEIVLVPAASDGRPALRAVLRLLAARQVQSLLVEGGSRIHAAFIRARLVDRVSLFLAPMLVGGGVPIASGTGLGIARGMPLSPFTITQVGDDLLIEADVVPRRRHRRFEEA